MGYEFIYFFPLRHSSAGGGLDTIQVIRKDTMSSGREVFRSNLSFKTCSMQLGRNNRFNSSVGSSNSRIELHHQFRLTCCMELLNTPN